MTGPQTYRIKLSDGREFDVQSEGGPPSEEDVLANLGQGPSAPPGPEGSATGRFAANVWELLNPVAMAKGLYDTARHPINTGAAILETQGNQLSRARQMFKEGRYSEAMGHGAAGLLPLVGPIAADAGEQMGAGDIAGGMGKATGLLAPFAMVPGLKALGVKVAPLSAAAKLEAGAASRVAEVMSPQSSAVKGLRMTAKAKSIAPELAKDTSNTAWSRSGLREHYASKLEDAALALDEAADARNAGKPYDTKPIVDALRAERAKLTAEPFEASHRMPVYGDPPANLPMPPERTGVPIGKDVIPHHNKATVAEIDRAITEVEALGPIAPYEALRRIRASYDKQARVKYNPAVTPDFLANQSVAEGAANVTGVIRDVLAKGDPETAAANAQYSLYKNATDIVTAADELERAKPKLGRRIVASLAGVITGTASGGVPGAIAGAAAGPIIETALAAAPVAIKLKTAQVMANMARAIRGGNEVKFLQLKFQLRDLAKQAAKAEVTRGTAAQAAPPQSQ